MKLYDTLTSHLEEMILPETVRIYTCGITPYDAAHLGHIFTFMTYDIIQRRLEDAGHQVQLVRNVTDVDDPIYEKAKELGIDYWQLAEQETADFQRILKALDFRPPFAEPLASEYIQAMAAATQQLLDSNHAYRLESDIYFDVSKIDGFGDFSKLSQRLQQAFMERRGGDPHRPGKRQPFDFLLWHGVSDPDDHAAWDSIVGHGRPGWHIECTVMAESLLGTPFDIHGGGSDLIFPHHECEIAQSKGLGQAQLARYWIHVAPISYLGEKMSKSLGNLVFAKDLLQTHDAAAIRLSLLRYHYRTGGEWRPEFLEEAAALIKALRIAQRHVSQAQAQEFLSRIRIAIDDDLDSHQILHILHDISTLPAAVEPIDESGEQTLLSALGLLGLAV